MNLDKKYKTAEGIECNILQMVKLEPEWAANIIQYYEDKLKDVDDLIKEACKEQREICANPDNFYFENASYIPLIIRNKIRERVLNTPEPNKEGV